MQFRDLLVQLQLGSDLSAAETESAFDTIMRGEAHASQVGAMLMGLATKGVSANELLGAVRAMRKFAKPIETHSPIVLDTCGTGGDVMHTFNISTAAAILAAACGVKVVKHGNRSASGKTGSADVLEKLGVNLDPSPEARDLCLEKANLCFAFARTYHPAMHHVADSRKALGFPTMFNLLGPLTNPANTRHQLIGVYSTELTLKFARVMNELGTERAWVVHADDGLDELSTMGVTRVCELREGRMLNWSLDATKLGLPKAKLDDLQVNDVEASAAALREIFDGVKGPKRDIAVLNAAAGLVICGKADSIESAVAIVQAAIDDGQAKKTLEALVRYSA